MYNFTSFTVSLNELETGMEKILAPTDCRLRPDIRGMENGNMGAWPRVSGRAQEGSASPHPTPLTNHTSRLLDRASQTACGERVKKFLVCCSPILL